MREWLNCPSGPPIGAMKTYACLSSWSRDACEKEGGGHQAPQNISLAHTGDIGHDLGAIPPPTAGKYAQGGGEPWGSAPHPEAHRSIGGGWLVRLPTETSVPECGLALVVDSSMRPA